MQTASISGEFTNSFQLAATLGISSAAAAAADDSGLRFTTIRESGAASEGTLCGTQDEGAYAVSMYSVRQLKR